MLQGIEHYPWQKGQWSKIMRQLDQEQLAHAYLFAGMKGVGKAQFAVALSAALFCESPDTTGHACGQCKQCLLFVNNTHPDIRYLSPEDGAKLIKVDQIREMAEFMTKSGQQGGRKIVVINPAEKMNVNAANALLKTLEEPTPNSILILLSDNVGSLLPTIRSRCQLLDFQVPPADVSSEWLRGVSSHSSSDGKLDYCLRLASGAPLLAHQLLEEGGADVNDEMLGHLSQVLKRETPITEIAKIWMDGDVSTYLTWMMAWLHQCIKYKLTLDDSQIFDESARKMLVFIAQKNNVETLFAMLADLQRHYLVATGQNNPNLQLMYEYILASWLELMPGASVK